MKAEVLVNNYVKLLDPAYPTHEISDTISRVQIPCSTEMYMLPSMISGTYRFQVTNEFSCGRTKTIQERNVRPRIFLKWEKKPPFTNWYVRTTGPYAWLRCESSLSQVLRRTHKTTGFFCCEFRHISSQFNSRKIRENLKNWARWNKSY